MTSTHHDRVLRRDRRRCGIAESSPDAWSPSLTHPQSRVASSRDWRPCSMFPLGRIDSGRPTSLGCTVTRDGTRLHRRLSSPPRTGEDPPRCSGTRGDPRGVGASTSSDRTGLRARHRSEPHSAARRGRDLLPPPGILAYHDDVPRAGLQLGATDRFPGHRKPTVRRGSGGAGWGVGQPLVGDPLRGAGWATGEGRGGALLRAPSGWRGTRASSLEGHRWTWRHVGRRTRRPLPRCHPRTFFPWGGF